MAKKKSNYATLFVAKRLNTVGLLHECVAITPMTKDGQKLPMYAVLHRALLEYKERHSGAAKAGRRLTV